MQSQTALFTTPPSYQLPKLKMLPLRDQPAYRVTANASACSLAELLAAVIGGEKQIETAEAVLARFQGDIHQIQRAHVDELGALRGVGQTTAIRIKAALALGARLSDYGGEKVQITSPADAAAAYTVANLRLGLEQKARGWRVAETLRIDNLGDRSYIGSVIVADGNGRFFEPAPRRSLALILSARLAF